MQTQLQYLWPSFLGPCSPPVVKEKLNLQFNGITQINQKIYFVRSNYRNKRAGPHKCLQSDPERFRLMCDWDAPMKDAQGPHINIVATL